MIAISNLESGSLIKVLPVESTKTIGFHQVFGFVSTDVLKERARRRVRHGFKEENEDKLLFKFELLDFSSGGKFKAKAVENCEIEQDESQWVLKSPRGNYKLKIVSDEKAPLPQKAEDSKKGLIVSSLISLLLPVLLFLMPRNQAVVQPEIIEQVTVKIKAEVQKPVTVSGLQDIPKEIKTSDQMKRAIKQDLGFLGLLGRKDLTKAIGGATTQLKEASAGAGPGGKQGSGGEYLVGLGEGLKRVTVGNSGVAGLGGIGTKGAGGGKGGYGNSMIGSGEGKALSSIPLSQEISLEGGLDRSVVQATIAKYLSQVRGCYEQGLKRNAGLGGLVSMAFEVGPEGNLNYAKVDKSTLGDSEVEECIVTRMKTWKFPNPRGGLGVKITYPFMLRSARS